MTYQSHDGEKATSNSRRKLERLFLPADLSGKTVLDIGCNEGFFCAEAKRRGANRVIGIDSLPAAIEFANGRYGDMGIQFEQRSWHDLPQGPFDIVLWLSAMHYELDPATVLRSISKLLAPNGVLILECGVFPGDGRQLAPVARPGDISWYPTSGFVYPLLSDFAARQVSPPELTPGDPVPRTVYHCRRRLPTVLVVRGKSQIGKTSLVRKLHDVATKTISIDGLLETLSAGKNGPTALARYLAGSFDSKHLEKVIKGIDGMGLTGEFAQILGRAIAPSDNLDVIDGYLTDMQVTHLSRLLVGRCALFIVDKVQFAERVGINLQSSEVVAAKSASDPDGRGLVNVRLEWGEAASRLALEANLESAIETSRELLAKLSTITDELETTRKKLEAERAERSRDRDVHMGELAAAMANARTQLNQYEDRARRAEEYNEHLVPIVAKLKEGAAEVERQKALVVEELQRQVTLQSERAKRAEEYSASLLEEIDRNKEDKMALQGEIDQIRDELSSKVQQSALALNESRAQLERLLDRLTMAEIREAETKGRFERLLAAEETRRKRAEEVSGELSERLLALEAKVLSNKGARENSFWQRLRGRD